jgi:hypothetical protein
LPHPSAALEERLPLGQALALGIPGNPRLLRSTSRAFPNRDWFVSDLANPIMWVSGMTSGHARRLRNSALVVASSFLAADTRHDLGRPCDSSTTRISKPIARYAHVKPRRIRVQESASTTLYGQRKTRVQRRRYATRTADGIHIVLVAKTKSPHSPTPRDIQLKAAPDRMRMRKLPRTSTGPRSKSRARLDSRSWLVRTISTYTALDGSWGRPAPRADGY